MKHLFAFFAVIFFAVVAGLLAHDDSGYVLFGRGYSTMEMSLTLFLVMPCYVLLCAAGECLSN